MRTLTLAASFLFMSGVALADPPAAPAPAQTPSTPASTGTGTGSPGQRELEQMAARFAPVKLTVDVSRLPESERQVLGKLVRAGRIMDALFLRQAWAGSYPMLLQLLSDTTPLGKARLHYFLINKGPWSRIDHNAPFLPGVAGKPASGSFFPADATRTELDAWFKGLTGPDKDKATGFFTTIRRGPDRKLFAVPYSVEYQSELGEVAALLREAAQLTGEPSLRAYLDKRAAALLSNDYYESDVAWMELDAAIEPTIGPYEVYEDEWFNFKAAFQSFIGVRDVAESQKLARFSAELQDIENHLPLEVKYRNPKIGALAPIRVINQVYCSGDANHGVQTAAYNLPNDERVAREKGTKRVMLKNVQEAKFRVVLTPIAKVALAEADRKKVGFDPFFTHILMHELMHGLGPHTISVAGTNTAAGQKTTVRQALEDSYSALEEAKADISGLWAMQYLIDKGVLDKSMEDTMYVTFLASAFRTIRFGIAEAHGKGQAMQLNFLLDQGAVRVSAQGTFSVDAAKIKGAVAALTKELLLIQAEGNKKRAVDLLGTLGVVRPEVQRVLDKLKTVPVDIEPVFTTAEELARAAGEKQK